MNESTTSSVLEQTAIPDTPSNARLCHLYPTFKIYPLKGMNVKSLSDIELPT